MGKNGRLSVKIQTFRTRFYGQTLQKTALSVNSQYNGQKFTDKSPENAGLSVKCVLLTDKLAKNGHLSVKLDEILAELADQHYIKNTGQKQSQIDRHCSVFRSIQAITGTFSSLL